MNHFVPNAKLAIRHLFTETVVDNEKMKVKGFRILVNDGQIQFAIHAIMLAELNSA